MNCPICGEDLSADDKLIAEWYAPRQWGVIGIFVLRHVRNFTRIEDDLTTITYDSYCASAYHSDAIVRMASGESTP